MIANSLPELLYPELSYKIVGLLFKVYNELGGGYQEKYYQKALCKIFDIEKIEYKDQLPVKLKAFGEEIGKYFIDFVIENSIVLEIKVGPRFYPRDIKQVLGYLKSTGLALGIVALFSRTELRFKRILKGAK